MLDEMQYTIRQATPLDFSAINALCVEAYREFESSVGPANWNDLLDILSHTSDLSTAGELLVAEDESGLLGVVLYVPPGRPDGTGVPVERASIRMLSVSPESRGRGIGRRLTQECIDRAKRDGAKAIGLTTGEMMKIAQPMYERMGFKREMELGERFGVKHGLYIMALDETI